MKYSLATLSAVVALVVAKPQFLNTNFQLQEGKPFVLQFSGCTEACTIIIQTGASNNLKDIEIITPSATGSSFTWTPDNIPSGIYNFKIVDKNGDINYSQQFPYQGTGSLTVSSSSSTHASTATTSSRTTLSTSTVASTTDSERSTSHTSTHSSTTGAPTTTGVSTTASREPATTTTGSPAAATTTKPPGSGAERISSPLALIAGVAIAIAYLS